MLCLDQSSVLLAAGLELTLFTSSPSALGPIANVLSEPDLSQPGRRISRAEGVSRGLDHST